MKTLRYNGKLGFPELLLEKFNLKEDENELAMAIINEYGMYSDTSSAILDIDTLCIPWMYNKMLGYKWIEFDLSENITLAEFVHPKDMKRMLNDLDHIQRFSSSKFESLYRIADFEGNYNWDLARCLPLKYDANNRTTHLIIFLHHLNHAFNNSKFDELITVEYKKKTAQMLLRKLTIREQEVLQYIGEAKSDEEIANTLMLSRKTVISHRRSLLRKLNAKNKLELLKIAFENGIVG